VNRHRAGALISAVALILGSACAPAHSGNRFIRHSERGPIEVMEQPFADPQKIDESVRQAVAAAQPPARVPLPTIETRDPALRAALRNLLAEPSAENHVRVGNAYRQVGVLDRSMDHYDAALKLDNRLAAAYDGRARVWRDWGLLSPALGDAMRATYYGGGVPAIQNTLATVLMELGRCGAAARVLEHVAEQHPNVSYVTENLAILARVAVERPERCVDGAVAKSREPRTSRERRASNREESCSPPKASTRSCHIRRLRRHRRRRGCRSI
jgi:tetratricopeptide (TPR) repeat protein